MVTVKSVQSANKFLFIMLFDVDLNFTIGILKICPGSDFVI